MKNLFKQVGLAVAVAGCAIPAYGVPTLRITDNFGNSVTITDQVAGDQDLGNVGRVKWEGSLNHWQLVAESGTSDPFTGTSTRPDMHMHVEFNLQAGASTQAGEFITFEFSDDFAGPTSGNAIASFSATWSGAGSNIRYNTYGDANGANLFGQTTPLTSQGPFTSSPASQNANGPSLASLGTDYALTQWLRVTAGAAGASVNGSSNDELTVPDGGMTLVLLGSSLTALGLFRRSFGRKV